MSEPTPQAHQPDPPVTPDDAHTDRDPAMQREAAALTAAWTQPQAMPESLRAKIEADGRAALAQRAAAQTTSPDLQLKRSTDDAPVPPQAQPRWSARLGYVGYAALAASLALLAWLGPTVLNDSTPASATAADRYAALTAPDASAERLAFNNLAADEAATGDVAWADAQDAGVLKLTGLPPSAGQDWQYQLWVVDPDRDARPVDGGVFDIPDTQGPAYIAFQTRLPVDRPTGFAITREQRGGVVVSAGPMLLVALAEPAS
ncbi:MAG: anti-sigma factor [Planctomycetota bacterium]